LIILKRIILSGEERLELYSIVTVKDVVRIPPSQFGSPIEEAAMIHLRKQHENVLDRNIGLMIAVIGIDDIGQGRLMPFKPLRGELVEGNVVELMDFGAFIRMGPLDGLCHVSQICDDFITQDSKGSSLLGKETGRTLSEGDMVRARVTSISFESGNKSGKLGLTMRQPFLGKMAKLKACKACHYLTNESMCPNCKGTNLSTSYTGIVVILPGKDAHEDPRKSSYVASRLNIEKPGKYALKVR